MIWFWFTHVCYSWDSAYEVEIQNFENHGAVGEIWFGEDSAMRIVR